MALKVDRKKTYTRVVKDPDDGTKYNVELRKMSEGDLQRRNDITTRATSEIKKKKQKGKATDTTIEYSFGRIRQFDLETSIVEWEFPFPNTARDLAALDPAVAAQIHDHIAELNPYIFRDVDEAVNEEDEDEEDEEDAPGLHAVDSADEDSQEFAEEDGPTTSVVSS